MLSNISFAQWNLSGNIAGSSDFIGTTNNEDLRFVTNNTTRMRLTSNSNLIFGTSSDIYKITLFDKNINGVFVQWSNVATLDAKFDGLLIGLNSGSLDAIIKQQENASLLFFTNGDNERLRITKTGYVGINNTNPTAQLDINGDYLALRNSNAAINRVLTSDENGLATWQEISLSIINDTIKVNGFSPKSLLDYKQSLNLTNNILSISNANNVDLSDYAQDILIVNDTLKLTNSNTSVYLASYLDNTDQQSLSLQNDTLTITGNDNKIDLTHYLPLTETQVDTYVANNNYLITEQDSSITNELQTLSVNSGQLEISNGNTIPLSSLNNIWQQNQNNGAYYNTGKVGIGIITPASNLHIHNTNPNQNNLNKGIGAGHGDVDAGEGQNISQHLTTTLELTNTNTGTEETDGLLIQQSDLNTIFNLQEDGNMSFITNKHNGLFLNKNGNTGIGVESPQSTLHIHNSNTANENGNGISTEEMGKTGETTEETASTIQLTNASTGNGQNNGLFISSYSKSGIINLNEIGYFDIRMQDQSALKISSNKKVQISTLSGNNDRLVVADNNGELSTIPTNSIGDNLGNHTATQNIILNANALLLKSSDINHGLRYSGSNSLFAGICVEGPVMYGWSGGALGTKRDDIEKIAIYWNDEGNVGIGTTQPEVPLTIRGTGNNNEVISFNDGASDQTKWHINLAVGTNKGLNIAQNVNGGDARLFIADGGNVGIGTSNPQAELHIKGNAGIINLEGTNHIFMQFYKYGFGNGNETRSGWVGYGSSGDDWFTVYNKIGGIRIMSKDYIYMDGNVGIGIANPSEKLMVNGKIFAQEIEVIDNVVPDYVFEPEYKLMNLTDLETFINKNKHLPEIPSAENVKENHLNLGKMNNLLLKKVEELTLYIIELQKQVNELKEKE